MARYSPNLNSAQATVKPASEPITNNTNLEENVTDTAVTEVDETAALEPTEGDPLDTDDTELEDDEFEDGDLDDGDLGDDDLDDDTAEDDSADDDTEDAAAKAERDAALKAEAEALVQEFGEQVTALVDGNADPATGALAPDVLAEIQKLYSAYLPGIRAKGLAREWVEEQMLDGVRNGDLPKAKSYMEIGPVLKVTQGGGGAKRKPGAPKKAKSPEDLFPFYAERLAELDLARSLIEIPDEVLEAEQASADPDMIRNIAEKLYTENYANTQAYIQYLKGEGERDEDGSAIEPEVNHFVKTAAKMALGRIAGKPGRKPSSADPNKPRAPRRSPEKHIQEVFEKEAVGTFLKISEIASRQSTEYGDDRPSPGAISSRLNNPSFGLDNIKFHEVDGLLGAKKVSA